MSKKNQVTENHAEEAQAAEKKVVTKYDRKMQKRAEEKAKEKKQAKVSAVIGAVVVIALVALIASFPIRTYVATHSTYITVNGESVNRVEFDYNFNVVKNNYINTYGSYLSYFGLDTSQDLSTQYYTDTLTWQDYFEEMAVESLKENKALKAEAEAEGYTYDTSEDYETFSENIKASAESEGVSVREYVSTVYGSYATMNRIKEYVKNDIYLNAYYTKLQDDLAPTEDEIVSYYEENQDSYDVVDYRWTTIQAELPTEPTELADTTEDTTSTDTTSTDATTETTDEETAYEPSEAEIEKAMADAKELADVAEESIATDGALYEGQTRSEISSALRDWLFDEGREKGDTTVIEDTDNNCYYILAFEQRYRDDTPSVDLRILVPEDGVDGQALLDTWAAGDATEDSFAELCRENSTESTAEENGGLYEQITEDNVPEALAEWIFDEGREAGDTTVITVAADDDETSSTTYVMYYVGLDDPEWMISIRSTLLSNTMSEHLEEISSVVEVEDPKGNLNYLKVQAEESAAAETAETETAETEATETTTEAN